MDDSHVDVTINDRTKIPLGWVISGGFLLIGAIVSIVLWASGIQNSAAQSAIEVAGVKQDIGEMKTDMKNMSKAQIRMETLLGVSPSYLKSKPLEDN